MTILPRYEDAFASLTPAHLARLCPALSLPPMHPSGRPWRGEDILAHARQHHISHADLVMSLYQDRHVDAVAAVEVLIMRPIDRRTPYEVNISRLARPPGSHRTAPKAPAGSRPGTIAPTAVIRVIATTNPKKPGSESHVRFALYRDGMTVAEFLSAGGRKADLTWDCEKGFISLGEPTDA